MIRPALSRIPGIKRVISIDHKRRMNVAARQVYWANLRDEPRHRDAIELIGVTSSMGDMTAAYLLGSFNSKADIDDMLAFHEDLSIKERISG